MKINRMCNDFVLVLKCYNEEDIDGIVTTEFRQDTTNFAEIFMVGPGCKHLTENDIGKKCLCPEWKNGMFRIDGEFFAIQENLIEFVVED